MRAARRRKLIRECLVEHGFAAPGDEAQITVGETYPIDLRAKKGIGWFNKGDIVDWARDCPSFRHRSIKSIEKAVAMAWADLSEEHDDDDVCLFFATIEGILVSRCAACNDALEPHSCMFDSVLCDNCRRQLSANLWAIIDPILPKVPIPDRLDPLSGLDVVTVEGLSVRTGIPVGTLKRAAWQQGLNSWKLGRDEVFDLFRIWRPNAKTRGKVEAFRLKIVRYEVERMSRMVRKIGGLIKERNRQCTTTQQTSERDSVSC